MKVALLIFFTLLASASLHGQSYKFSIFAGQKNVAGTNDGIGTAAQFNHPQGLACLPLGQLVFIADTQNNSVRQITPTGQVETIAPVIQRVYDPNGIAQPAGLYVGTNFVAPQGITFSSQAGHLYITEYNIVFQLDVGTNAAEPGIFAGFINYIAGSSAGFQDGYYTNGEFSRPYGMATDSAGSVYVADQNNDAIRKLVPGALTTIITPSLAITTFFPVNDNPQTNPPPSSPYLGSPTGLAIDSSNNIYVAVTNGYVAKITSSNVLSLIMLPNDAVPVSQGVAVDRFDNAYVVATPSNTVVRISPFGICTTLGTLPTQGQIAGIAVDDFLNLYFADMDNSVILKGAPGYPAFFNGAVPVSGGADDLQFTNGTSFGFFYLVDFPYIYHADLGWEYCFDPNDGQGSVYFYDFASASWWYTTPQVFPYVYDFTLKAWLYYFPESNVPGRYTSNPRYFYNFGTGQVITR